MYRIKYLAAILISFTLFWACNDQGINNEAPANNSGQDFDEVLCKRKCVC